MNRRQFLTGLVAIVSASVLPAQEANSKEDYIRMTDSYVNNKQYSEAIEIGTEGIEKFPRAWELYISVATAHGRSGKSQKSIECLEHLLIVYKGNPKIEAEAYHGLVIDYYNLRQIEKCKECIYKGMELIPKDPIYSSALKLIEKFFGDK